MEIIYDDFKKVQIKVGTVLEVRKNEKARKPSLVVKVDFGKEIGIDGSLLYNNKSDKICGEKNRGAARDDAWIWTRTRITQSPPRV